MKSRSIRRPSGRVALTWTRPLKTMVVWSNLCACPSVVWPCRSLFGRMKMFPETNSMASRVPGGDRECRHGDGLAGGDRGVVEHEVGRGVALDVAVRRTVIYAEALCRAGARGGDRP